MPAPGYISAANPVLVLDAVTAIVGGRQDWRVHNRMPAGEQDGLAVLYLGHDLPLKEFGFVLSVFGDRPNEIQLTVYASPRRKNAHFPTEAEYDAGEEKAWALVRQAGRQVGLRLRLRHPVRRPNPLRGRLRREFERFVAAASNFWTGERRQHLDPRDEVVFHDFIRLAHRYRSVLTSEDVNHHLREAGFEGELVTDLVRQYVTGRRILSRQIYPWEERERRRVTLERRRKADARELAECLARRQEAARHTRGANREV